MTLAAVIKRNVALACLYYVFDGYRRRQRLRMGILTTRSGARHADLDIAGSLDYIDRVWRDYLAYSGRSVITGRVVEIGPGDNFGVALHCLQQGAASVVAIDKFISERDPAQQAAIYRAMAVRYGMDGLFDGAPSEASIRNLTYLPGMPAERYFTAQNSGYDCVLSRAVLEHLDDPLGALDAMWEGLKPGGMLVHRVDLRDHGMFAGSHPLTYLTIPAMLYRVMAAETGRPNRVLFPAYRDHAARRGWVSRLGVTRLVGQAGEFPGVAWPELPAAAREAALRVVADIRPRLAPAFAALRDEDLAVSGFVIVCEKPARL